MHLCNRLPCAFARRLACPATKEHRVHFQVPQPGVWFLCAQLVTAPVRACWQCSEASGHWRLGCPRSGPGVCVWLLEPEQWLWLVPSVAQGGTPHCFEGVAGLCEPADLLLSVLSKPGAKLDRPSLCGLGKPFK